MDKNAEISYQLAEKKAAQYFQTLYRDVKEENYITALIKDIHSWKQQHVYRSLFPIGRKAKKKTHTEDYDGYIKWLNYTGKLEPYLDRSISYIFMRDIGKDLTSMDTQTRIQNVVTHLKDQLLQTTSNDKNEESTLFSITGLYRWGQKEGIESTIIWLIDKLKNVSRNIPEGLDATHARRKLLKIIAGVVINEMEQLEQNLSGDDRSKKLDTAIRLGYAYGLTYPFIDDLLDATVLSSVEKKKYSTIIRTTLLTESVPPLGEWTGKNQELLQFIHSELTEAFQYIKNQQSKETVHSFFEQSYVFFHSQEVDRKKELSDETYTNEDLYIPIMIKSSSSRLIVRSLLRAPKDKDIEDRVFYYGIYNQLADDFADMFSDMEGGAVTPYTYYLKYHKQRNDLVNPFALYWAVISYLIHNVYRSDSKAMEIILNRAINGLKRFKKRVGSKVYEEVMEIFAISNSSFTQLIQKMVRKADDVDFFDKLIRDHMVTNLKNEQKEQEEFSELIDDVRTKINELLHINLKDSSPITDAANYSLNGDGKRLRPVVAWMMGVKEYGLNEKAIFPLLKSIEYMHTASLIYDDLPSQDNANFRRGQPTVHQSYNTAVAELTGLFLTQRAVAEQASLTHFDTKIVLKLIQYSAESTMDMCKGQVMDLESRGKSLSLEQLNQLCFLKTGKGFEAALIMPSILANVDEIQIEALKRFAYHGGIAFQIKDDLLDVEGTIDLLGKSVGKDAENNHSTFVSVLGMEAAKKEMWEHYCLAMEALQEIQLKSTFLKQILNHFVQRDR
ncbi:polyprenyl synthetase family protein [Fredinandcohnia sp. QZ13]|uniref:polyprenyl synthetase family protein n=1 Tax=Fredinandcohnia sp. QZ13 TaxID=3073144 RepID=UPI002853272E|nr:polyprenyl synthetase family protein [Fredinandcohnia sp. QZ13]MDR4886133.1 polyprenyl synthetase family protein [Fredinandcohnia sp. QZ13]